MSRPIVRVSMQANLPKLTRVTRNLENEIDKAVRRTAFKLQQKAIERLTKTVYSHNRQPTPTGALRASIFVRTHKTDNYRGQMLRATSKRAARDGSVRLALISEPPPIPPKGVAWVGVGMAYGVYIEYPTRGRPGTYYMRGAAADVKRFFFDQVKAAIIAAGQGGTIPDDWDSFVDSAVNNSGGQ